MSDENQSTQTGSAREPDVSRADDGSEAMKTQPKEDRQHLAKRIDSLDQENRALQTELQTYKMRLKASQEEVQHLKQSSVGVQVNNEQEEESKSAVLLRTTDESRPEKSALVDGCQGEEKLLANDLSRKLQIVVEEKQLLEKSLAHEQSAQMGRLMKRIQQLETEIVNKEATLDQLRNEKCRLENDLEKEQECFVNRLWSRMKKLEADKTQLQLKVQQLSPCETIASPVSSTANECPSVYSTPAGDNFPSGDHSDAKQLCRQIEQLRQQLTAQQMLDKNEVDRFFLNEQSAKTENLRLRTKLQMETDRRDQLYKQLSESESSVEVEEERALNDKMKFHTRPDQPRTNPASSTQHDWIRSRTSSTPAFITCPRAEHRHTRRLMSNCFQGDSRTE